MAREAVLHRTVRMESRKGRVRPSDWNTVSTSVGAGIEPRVLKTAADGFNSVDQDDCINRVDRVEFDADNRDPYHRDPYHNTPLIGGIAGSLGYNRSFSDQALDNV
ncbi:hypothetical protein KA005_19580 [bacterium]|nr:hypothetical protein [bacterium]